MSGRAVNPKGALSRERAADYVDVSPNSFDELVRAGLMPQPHTYAPVVNRKVWLIEELDAALRELPNANKPASEYEGVDL